MSLSSSSFSQALEANCPTVSFSTASENKSPCSPYWSARTKSSTKV